MPLAAVKPEAHPGEGCDAQGGALGGAMGELAEGPAASGDDSPEGEDNEEEVMSMAGTLEFEAVE